MFTVFCDDSCPMTGSRRTDITRPTGNTVQENTIAAFFLFNPSSEYD
jgi:hypothetical protein